MPGFDNYHCATSKNICGQASRPVLRRWMQSSSLSMLKVYLRPHHNIVFSLGGDVWEALRLPVPTYRSANLHFTALFTFRGVEGLNST